MPSREHFLLVTCEHGGNRVPAALRVRFARAGRVLASHRGYDIGALPVARGLARLWRAPLLFSTTSRLVVDLNRSADRPAVFSRFTAGLGADQRAALLARHHAPHRQAVEAAVARGLERADLVVHVAVHSFTPVLNGQRRPNDVGLLFDPRRELERVFCRAWQGALAARGVAVRRNYPYRGISDGVPTWLRRRFAGEPYVGVELELNQRRLAAQPARVTARLIADTLREALAAR